MNYCEACGMPMTKPEDHAKGDLNAKFCLYCANEDGSVKSANEIFEGGVQFFMSQIGGDRALAEKIARKNMNQQSYWQGKNEPILQGEEATDKEFAEVMNKMQ